MNSANLGIILRRLRQIAPPTIEADAELLTRYGLGDQEAFAVLVERYSGLVWGVGRRILHRQQDGEDVFQATFLALSRKFSLLKGESSLAPWLYTVAVRLALKIKRRQRQETYLLDMAEPATRVDPSAEVSGRELARAFDEEMERLPETYREALVLCCLEGLSRDEAAGLAACSLSVMKNRLERGRKLLRQRLERRGIAVPATLLLVGLTSRCAPAAMRAAACRLYETASPSVVALAGEAVAGSMMIKTIIVIVALGLTAACIRIGGSLLADQPPASKMPSAPFIAQAKQPAKEEPANQTKPRLDRFGDPLPEEALARFGTVRFRQGFSLISICYSPDGKAIAITGNGSKGRSLGLWDAATGKELFQFDDGKSDVQFGCITFSPDGTMLAAARRENVQLLSARTGEPIRQMKGHAGWIGALVFSVDGKTLISGGSDRTMRFWSVATGQEIAKLEKHTDSVTALALSSNGKLLASAGSDKIIRVWDTETRGLLHEFQQGPRVYVPSVSFSPDGKFLASAGYEEQCIVWDLVTGKAAYKLDTDNKPVTKAVFAPNGKWLAAGCGDTIRLYEPSTGKEIRRWQAQDTYIHTLAVSSDSKMIAANSSWHCGARIWDAETGKETPSFEGLRSMIGQVQLSHDGKSLFGLGLMDRRVIRWNVETADAVETVPMSAAAIGTVNVLPPGRATLSPGGDFLAWASENDVKTIHLMDLKTHQDACEPLKIESAPYAMRFSPDGKTLAFGCDEGLLYIWKWQTERNPKPLKGPELYGLPRLFTHDSKHLITGSLDVMYIWDVAARKKIRSFPGNRFNHNADNVAISPDGKWVVCAFGRDQTTPAHLKVIDMESGKVAREIGVDPEGVRTLMLSPDGRVLAFENSMRESDFKLIDFATAETIATFRGHHSGVWVFQFAPDGRTLYSGGGDSTILKWDATARHGKGPSTLNAAAGWEALAQDASKAYPAGWDLVDAPKEAITLLRQKIQPAKKLDLKEIQPMVDLLDAEKFAQREKAAKDLQSLGYSVEPILHKLLETEKRPEVKQRLQTILDQLGSQFVRVRRALQALETINNADSKQLLRELADGASGCMLTNEATSGLDRIGR
jgi:RNA polymerase sigma factor (sigma-70 family)